MLYEKEEKELSIFTQRTVKVDMYMCSMCVCIGVCIVCINMQG